MEKMKILAIIQARMGSTRLPNKVMRNINGMPMIELLIKRLRQASLIDEIIVATADKPENQCLLEHLEKISCNYYVGSENDVLDRYYQGAKKFGGDVIIRITGDCPLVDASLVDECINLFLSNKIDYLSNISPPTFPDGLDIEVFSFEALEMAHKEAKTDYDREHVTPYLRNSTYLSRYTLKNSDDLSRIRWTVDESADLEVIENIFNEFSPDIFFDWKKVLELYNTKNEIFLANTHITRNIGGDLGTGQKLWIRAKNIIPDGNMLLSKRSEMFLPNLWPSYFQKSSGCNVWDLDGKMFIDFSIMGVGTNTLGYGYASVDAAVQAMITNGNMSTFNCPEEVYLAERLVELHPWAEMVKHARTGGEANSIAIRIARAASGRDKVAICGYHGWHDWYLSANLGNDNSLDGHLLPGLETKGVPSNLRNSVFPFEYNNYEQLLELINKEDIGTIMMEVSRNMGPENDFLSKVRTLATQKGIVLIFDECTSGFRETFGGLHLKFGVNPDIAIFGKALGNGYAITSIIGTRAVMEVAQNTFISSTFWTERIGPTAALATLRSMEEIKSWQIITDVGHKINSGWKDLAKKHSLELQYWGLPALGGFTFASKNHLAYKTLLTQEMLNKGYLAGNCVYACISHTDDKIDSYLSNLDPVFALIRACESGDEDVYSHLKTSVCQGGFKRMN